MEKPVRSVTPGVYLKAHPDNAVAVMERQGRLRRVANHPAIFSIAVGVTTAIMLMIGIPSSG